jgi:hypothetical protein
MSGSGGIDLNDVGAARLRRGLCEQRGYADREDYDGDQKKRSDSVLGIHKFGLGARRKRRAELTLAARAK